MKEGNHSLHIPSFLKLGPISNIFDMPPTIRRFNQSSGAILKFSLRLENSVATVSKGRATAPPAAAARIGVWTSTKSLSSKNLLIIRTISARRMRTRIASGFESMTTCLSISWPASSVIARIGKWWRHGESIVGSCMALIDNSPVSVR